MSELKNWLGRLADDEKAKVKTYKNPSVADNGERQGLAAKLRDKNGIYYRLTPEGRKLIGK